MNYQDIVNDDPGGDIASALVALKAMTVEKRVTLNSAQLNKWAAVNQVREAVTDAAANPAHPAYDAANAALFALIDSSSDLDLEDTETLLLLDALIQAGVISSAAKDDLIARSIVQELKYPRLRYGDIEKARADV